MGCGEVRVAHGLLWQELAVSGTEHVCMHIPSPLIIVLMNMRAELPSADKRNCEMGKAGQFTSGSTSILEKLSGSSGRH